MYVYRPISEVALRHMISRTGGLSSKYLFAMNDVVTQIRIFIMIVSLISKNLHKHISMAHVIWDLKKNIQLIVWSALLVMHKMRGFFSVHKNACENVCVVKNLDTA